jgi:hypothetical protein
MPAPDDAQLESLQTEIDQLRRRSDHVSEQLRLSIQNLARMLDEYSSLFEGSTTDDLSGAPLIAEAQELIAEADQLGVGVNAVPETETDAEVSESPEVSASVDEVGDEATGATTDVDLASDVEEASDSGKPGDTPDAEREVASAAIADVDDVPTQDEPGVESVTSPTEATDVGSDFEVDEFLAESPDDELLTGEPADSDASKPDSAGDFAPPAADELMASLDANLPEAPDESPPIAEPAVTDAEIDDLFDAEPGFDIVESLADDSGHDSETSLEADERDGESVTIVQKEQTKRA